MSKIMINRIMSAQSVILMVDVNLMLQLVVNTRPTHNFDD